MHLHAPNTLLPTLLFASAAMTIAFLFDVVPLFHQINLNPLCVFPDTLKKWTSEMKTYLVWGKIKLLDPSRWAMKPYKCHLFLPNDFQIKFTHYGVILVDKYSFRRESEGGVFKIKLQTCFSIWIIIYNEFLSCCYLSSACLPSTFSAVRDQR